MAAESPDELRAMAAVGEMRPRLALLLRVGEPGRVDLQNGLSVRAPAPALHGAHPFRHLVDAAGDLLAVRARRQALHEAAHLARLEPPSVAEQHHRAPARRQRCEHVARDAALLGAGRELLRRSRLIGDAADELERRGRLALAAADLLARLVRDRREHVAADLVVGEAGLAARRAPGASRPTRRRRCRRARRARRRRGTPAAPSPWPGPRTPRTGGPERSRQSGSVGRPSAVRAGAVTGFIRLP